MADMSPNLLAMRQVLEKCGSGRISSDRALAEKGIVRSRTCKSHVPAGHREVDFLEYVEFLKQKQVRVQPMGFMLGNFLPGYSTGRGR